MFTGHRSHIRSVNRWHGFTLVEMLVVISIIAMLISLLLPALSSARRLARSTVCLSNEKQFAFAIHNYLTDNKDWLPSSHDWSSGSPVNNNITGILLYYINDSSFKVRRCPNGPVLTSSSNQQYEIQYGMPYSLIASRAVLANNGGVSRKNARMRLDMVPQHALGNLIAETAYPGGLASHALYGWGYDKFNAESYINLDDGLIITNKRHGNSSNFLYVDGHARSISAEDFKNRNTNQIIRVIWP